MKRKSEYAKACATAASRERMARAVAELATRYGAACETKPGALPGDERRLGVYIATGPFRCFAHFDGRSRVDSFLSHWSMTGTEGQYPEGFGVAVRGSVNQFHHRKATGFADAFESFLQSVEGGLRALAEQGLAGTLPAPADSSGKPYRGYQAMIREITPDHDPRHVEAYMRLEHSTLDSLSREQFATEVRMAAACIAYCGASHAEQLARSYGL